MIAVVLGPLQEAMLERDRAQRAATCRPRRASVSRTCAAGGVAGYVLLLVLQLVVGAMFAALGGLLGAMYFRKDVPPALGGNWVPPLPPQ